MPQPLPAIMPPDYEPTLNAFRMGQADKIAADKRDLMKQAGGLAAAGNLTGARNAFYKGGDFDNARAISADQRAASADSRAAAAHTASMSDHALTKALKGQEFLGRITDEIQKSPNPQMALDQAKARLRGLGLNVDSVQLEQLNMLKAQGLSVEDQYRRELQERQFAAEQERARLAQSNVDRSYNLQERSFNQQSGIEEKRLEQQQTQFASNEELKRAQLQLLKDKVAAGKAPKPLTESQATARAYLTEVEDVNKRLDPTTPDGKRNDDYVLTDKGENPLSEATDAIAANKYTPGIIANRFLNKKQKQFLQSAEQFISVLLYKRSGAQISSEEFGRNYNIYFPRPGDDQQTLRNKAQARRKVIEGLKIQGGFDAPGAPSNASNEADLPDGFKILGVE